MQYGTPRGEEKETEILFKVIMGENIPNMARKINIQIHEVQKNPNRLKPKRAALRHIIIRRQIQRQIEIFENSMRKATHHTRECP